MNTKQKLTLGIAAIFMVTLTIVGVTYAYFVTRVNYSSTATAVVQTASIGATFHDGKLTELKNAMPGDKAYHLFAVENGGGTSVPYTLALATYQDNSLPEFVHSDLTDSETFSETGGYASVGKLTGTCYMSEDAAKAYTTEADITTARSSCYNDVGAGSVYDNLIMRLYRLDYSGTITDFEAINLSYGGYVDNEETTDVDEGTTDYQTSFEANIASIVGTAPTADPVSEGTGLLKNAVRVTVGGVANDLYAPFSTNVFSNINMTAAGNAITIADNELLAGKDPDALTNVFNYYLLEIEYVDIEKNQNIENEAFVGFKVDMVSSAITQ